jgi:predicted nucleic acid-binding protein
MTAVNTFFVDSNLLLYYVDPIDIFKQERAAEWLNHLWMTGSGRLSWQVLHEFYQNSVKKMRLEPVKARQIVEDLVHWQPVDTSLGLVQRAWHWADEAQVSYWDALIIAAAERSGAQYLLSEDFQTKRRYADVQVINPFEQSPAGVTV